MWSNQPAIRVFSGICPDEACRTKLFFPSYSASSIECTGCGKHFSKDGLNSVELIQDSEEAFRSLLRSVLLTGTALKKGTDLVKVRGYSNYHCRILSPILTYHGMEKTTSKAKLLRDMGQGEFFDCANVGDRAFSLEPEYLETPGYGQDKSGSLSYLHGFLEEVKLDNGNENRLIPLHVDGDGYCLVHAISRALIGREIFWHALMVNLHNHLKVNITKYEDLFADFISRDEWDLIISEADPDFQPADGQPLGLRNIHIFGLANVLHRPIILLDSVSGIQSSADYTGTFLPALVPVHLCKTKDGKHIPPLAIAWSSSGRNHFIPLVNLRGKPLAKLSSRVVPKAWGIPNEQIKAYINFEPNDMCVIGGTRGMSDSYVGRLMKAMDEKFLEINNISASLVTEVHQFIFKPSGLVGVRPKTVIERTGQSVEMGLLMRCLSCNAVSEFTCPVNQEWLAPGGSMYLSASRAAQAQGGFSIGELYSFPDHNIMCTYNAEKDVLEVVKYKGVDVKDCTLCKGSLRKVKPDGRPIYKNGDRTSTPVSGPSRCTCGFKHYWDGKEYDNQPELLPVSLEWGGMPIKEKVHWFQYESDPTLNSNVYAVAGKLVQKYFPGEFGSERLVQKVVDTILRQTARKEGENKGARPDIPNLGAAPSQADDPMQYSPSKIILTGQKKKTFHKEELNKSDAERRVKIKTEHHAPLTQNRQTRLQKAPEKSPVKPQPVKQEPSPSSPRPRSSQGPRNNKRIRLSSSTGGQHDLTLPLNVTYNQLQEAIKKELGVPPREQKIRFGFPPRVLLPPEEGKEDEPIPVQHGERVMVEVLPPPVPEPKEVKDEPETKMDVAGAMGGEGNTAGNESAKTASTESSPMDVDVDTSALASALMSALSGTLPTDMWESACRSPQMFEHGGYYYNMAANSLGDLTDDQHCTFPNLPNKVFSYNKAKDRLELCLGKIHVPVQPHGQETQEESQRTSHSTQSPVMNTESSFSGAITHRSSNRSTMAFTGEGRSLSEASSPNQQEKEHVEAKEKASNERQTLATGSKSTEGAVFTPKSTEKQQDKDIEMLPGNSATSTEHALTERLPSQIQAGGTDEASKPVSMETNGDSKQNQLDPKESNMSLQSSGTVDTDMTVDSVEPRDEVERFSGFKSPLSSEKADNTMECSADQTMTENANTMEIEAEFPRDEPADKDQVPTSDSKDSTLGYKSNTNDNQTAMPRDKDQAGSEASLVGIGSPTFNLQEPEDSGAGEHKETQDYPAPITTDNLKPLANESNGS